MHADLAVRRRVLFVTYQRYMKADRAWEIERREMESWFPSSSQSGLLIIGNPGSKIRKVYQERQQALMQLEAARLKLEAARRRLTARREETQAAWVVLLT